MQLFLTPAGSLKATSSAIPPSSSVICCRASTVSVPNKAAPERSPSPSDLSCRFDANKSTTLAAILLPIAGACAVFTACPAPVEAGILSGSTGLESFELPSIPAPSVLKKIQEANVAKYKAFDENFKKSPFLQKLLKKSKDNEMQHKKEIADKYCERGAEWGVAPLGTPGGDATNLEGLGILLRGAPLTPNMTFIYWGMLTAALTPDPAPAAILATSFVLATIGFSSVASFCPIR